MIPDALDTPEFREAWSDWCVARSERRKPITPRAAKAQLKSLAAVGVDRAIETINLSIANDWQGLFPQKSASSGNASPARIHSNEPSGATHDVIDL